MYMFVYLFNYYLLRIVRLTSPKLNYVVVVALLFSCLAGILYPFPTNNLATLKVLCPVRVYTLYKYLFKYVFVFVSECECGTLPDGKMLPK